MSGHVASTQRDAWSSHAPAQGPYEPASTTCHPFATNNATNPRRKPHDHAVSTELSQLH